jgi:hypothetical protein
MDTQTIGAKAKLVLHGILNIAGNSVIIAALPALFPPAIVAIIFLVFNLAQIIYAFTDPSYAIHPIQTGQMSLPPSQITKNPLQ